MVWALQNLLDTAAAAPSPSSDSISLQSPPSLLPPHFLEIPPQSSDSPGLRRLPGETDPFEALVPGQPAPPGVRASLLLAGHLPACLCAHLLRAAAGGRVLQAPLWAPPAPFHTLTPQSPLWRGQPPAGHSKSAASSSCTRLGRSTETEKMSWGLLNSPRTEVA